MCHTDISGNTDSGILITLQANYGDKVCPAHSIFACDDCAYLDKNFQKRSDVEHSIHKPSGPGEAFFLSMLQLNFLLNLALAIKLPVH